MLLILKVKREFSKVAGIEANKPKHITFLYPNNEYLEMKFKSHAIYNIIK